MNAHQRRKFNRNNWRDTVTRHKAGGMPPTELPPLPTEAEIEASHRQFQRDVMVIYAIVFAVIGAIAYFS